jgi:hypothetical protein
MGPHPRWIISLPRAPAAGASAAKASPTTPLPPPAAPVTRAALREPSASLKRPSDAAAKATRRRKLNEAIAWLSETYPSVFGTVKPNRVFAMLDAHRLDHIAVETATPGAVGDERVEIGKRACAPLQRVVERPAPDLGGLRLRPDLFADSERQRQ